MASEMQQFDVCVVCALPEEARAFLGVVEQQCEVVFEQHISPRSHFSYRSTTIKNNESEPLTLHVSWLPRFGPQEMMLHLSRILEECQPRIAIMTGICAGDAHRVQLGDLVVAERIFTYDSGKFTLDEQGKKVHLYDTLTYQLDANILQFLGLFDDWEPLIAHLERPSSASKQHKMVCHIKPMASGNAVRADNPFEDVQARVRGTVAIDMEGAAFGLVMSHHPLIPWLVVKGICDYADRAKNDNYHGYAAYSSALYALSFIRAYVTEQRMPRKGRSEAVERKDSHGTKSTTNFSSMLGMLLSRIGLTQSDAADLLGVSTNTIRNWELGVSIPQQAERLRQLTEALFMQDAFSEGREQEEAEVLWESAGKDALFDTRWFKELLAKKTSSSGISIFYCYAHEDEQLRNVLEKHLSSLRRLGYITEWHDRCIVPGTDWAAEIDRHLMQAAIILLLISSDFFASDYVYSIEMKRALERHKAGKARVIPIVLRPVDWLDTPFARLSTLPRNGKPVTTWDNQDEAFLEITQGIRRVIEELRTPKFAEPGTVSRSPNYPSHFYLLHEVFKRSGVPKITFVEREDFELLKLCLAQPGRGVVIEGPSGIGKTTTVEKAVEALSSRRDGMSPESMTQILSARDPEHRSKLQTLRQWHLGTVIIDDFHRLDPQLQVELTDYLKYLADTEPASKKLVIVGIPQTGQTLVDTSFDVAMRIDVFKVGLVNDELLLSMIEKGEEALNLKFSRKSEIVLAAGGSLNIAQFLCFNICYREHCVETQKETRLISCNISAAVADVLTRLSRKFGESIKRFAAMGGSKDPTTLMILEELASSEDGFLSLPALTGRRPALAQGIARLLREGWMNKLYNEYSDCAHHLFFDQTAQALVIDDPQLAFYLKKIQFSLLSREAGKGAPLAQQKIFISYSHKDAKWLERLRVHLAPIERDGIIDLWDDTKIIAGAQWKEAILEALETARIAIALISANFIASDFIAQHELPELLSRAAAGGTVILPIIISPCLFDKTGLSVFQTINPPDKPLSAMTSSDRERVWVSVVEAVRKRLTIDAE